MEIVAETGLGKSAFVFQVVRDALADGKKVLVIETEDNTDAQGSNSLASVPIHPNLEFQQIMDANMIFQFLKNRINITSQQVTRRVINLDKTVSEYIKWENLFPVNDPHYDLIVLDSLGMPILNKYAELNMKERGDALIAATGISGMFKRYCKHNNCLCIVTNQFISTMSGVKDRHPFGDKSKFNFKQIWELKRVIKSAIQTKSEILIWRARDRGEKTKIGQVLITQKGMEITFSI